MKRETVSSWNFDNANVSIPEAVGALSHLVYKVSSVASKQGYRRRALAKRDGNRCFYCHEAFDAYERPPTIDHKTPKCRGGSNSLDNLVLACWPCNRRKGALTAVEFSLTKYVQRRQAQTEASDRRCVAFSHTQLYFLFRGDWYCCACGSNGTRRESPTLVACLQPGVDVRR